MRGRAISILLMAIFGMMPLGSLLVGAVSQHIGAPATVLCQGIIALIISLAFIRFLTGKGEQKTAKEVVMVEVAEERVRG